MKYAYYKTDGTAEFIETQEPIKFEQLKELVGGWIEGYRTQHGELVYINEEGRLDDLPSNPFYFEDLRGNVVEYSHVDETGESIGFGDDYVLRTIPKLPQELFEKGNKFTIVWVSDSWGMTADSEIQTVGRGFNGKDEKPVFKLRGKRKEVGWLSRNDSIMVFRGWDLPIKNANTLQRTEGGHLLRANAMYNLSGLPVDEMATYVRENQINPFFIPYDHVLHVAQDGTETLVYPHAPATSQRIADMQSAQLKDGVERIVMR
jgi:hypothetical protein